MQRVSFYVVLSLIIFSVLGGSWFYLGQYRNSNQFERLALENHVSFDTSMRVNEFPNLLKKSEQKYIYDLFKQLYEDKDFRVVVPQVETKIPKIFHYIWFGIKLPDEYRPFLKSWLDLHPDWIFIFWVDNPQNYELGAYVGELSFEQMEDLLKYQLKPGARIVVDVKNLKFFNRVFFDSVRNYGERSDILKWEVVYRFGGTYIDVDCECFKPLDVLHHMYDFYVGVQPLDTVMIQLGAALYGAIPHHPILKQCVDTIKDDRSHSQVVLKTGPIHFTKSFLRIAGSTGYTDVVLPASYFYPCAYGQAGTPCNQWQRPESFATHHWAGSWLKKEGWAPVTVRTKWEHA